ncbi:MAG: SAM-dependent methyltransferase [Demequinaceae bacterium]|nr:SAM-dependent methyltransferase [Demequinaceae bacterium]
MEIGEVRAALSAEGRALLRTLPAYRPSDALNQGDRLRGQGYPADVVSAVMTQARLRDKARNKFGDFADGMLFTPDGLEQATRLRVAALHARRFIEAGIERVADLTAGIGADAMAMSALGIAVMAFERDESTALVADHNLRHWPDSVVVHADSLSVIREADVDGVFADPARRTKAKGRSHRLADYEPALADLLGLRDRYPALGLKLGPGIPHSSLPSDAEAEWVSDAGQVVEVGLWCGPLARRLGRGSLVLCSDGFHRLSDTSATAGVGPVDHYLFEPDGAVIRAGLVAEVAQAVDGRLIDRTIAFVTGPRLVSTPFATAYRIVDNLPFGVKNLRSYLRERGIGRVTIKKRGTAVTPEGLRSELRLKGDEEATIVLTRVSGEQRILVVEPV